MPADLNDRLERFAENEAPDLWDDILARSQNAEVTPLNATTEDRSPRWFMVAAALLLVIGGAGLALRSITGDNDGRVVSGPPAPSVGQILAADGTEAELIELCLNHMADYEDLHSLPNREGLLKKSIIFSQEFDRFHGNSFEFYPARSVLLFDNSGWSYVCHLNGDGSQNEPNRVVGEWQGQITAPERSGLSTEFGDSTTFGRVGAEVTKVRFESAHAQPVEVAPLGGWFILPDVEPPRPETLGAKLRNDWLSYLTGRFIWTTTSDRSFEQAAPFQRWARGKVLCASLDVSCIRQRIGVVVAEADAPHSNAQLGAIGDGKITDDEAVEAVQRFNACMADSGWSVLPDAWLKLSLNDQDQYSDQVDTCDANELGTTLFIDGLQREIALILEDGIEPIEIDGPATSSSTTPVPPTVSEILEDGGDRADRLELCLERLGEMTNDLDDFDPFGQWWPNPVDVMSRGAVELLGSESSGPTNIPEETRSTWLLNIGGERSIVTCDVGEVPGLDERRATSFGLATPVAIPSNSEVSISKTAEMIIGVAGTDVARIDLFDREGTMIQAFDRPESGWFIVRSEALYATTSSELRDLIADQEERVIWKRHEVAWSTTDGRYARQPVNDSYDIRSGDCVVRGNCNELLNDEIARAQVQFPDTADALTDRHITFDEFETLIGLADECMVAGEEILRDRGEATDSSIYSMETVCFAEFVDRSLWIIDIQTARATAEAKSTPS